jgi:hypothetical protein
MSCASAGKPAPAAGERAPPAQTVADEMHGPDPWVSEMVVADINGDRYPDLVVGMPATGRDNVPARGQVAVWFGGQDGLGARPDATFIEPLVGVGSLLGSFGEAVVSVGDVNHDGFDDVLVGAPAVGSCVAPPSAGLPPRAAGRVFLLLGGHDGFAPAPAAFVDGTVMGGHLGGAFSGAGDVDGDGRPEVVIVATGGGRSICWERMDREPTRLPDRAPRGELVLSVGPAGFSPWSVNDAPVSRKEEKSEEPEQQVWHRVTGDVDRDGRANLLSMRDFPDIAVSPGATAIGDVNGDGIPDLVVGHGEYERGRVYFYPGQARRGIQAAPAMMLMAPPLAEPGVPLTPQGESYLTHTSFGHPVVVTDVDHDGFADVLVGAPQASRIYVYAGSPTGPREPARQMITRVAGSPFPEHMAAGDFDGDGYGDVATTEIGLRRIGDPFPKLIVYRGSPDGLVKTPAVKTAIPVGR